MSQLPQILISNFRQTLYQLMLLLLLIAVMSCNGFQERQMTGVERIDLGEGGIQLLATAMASQKAIEKDSTAMMRATSQEAARLMILAELESPQYGAIRSKFKILEAEFIDRGRYCRLLAIYQPESPATQLPQ